MRRRIIPYNAKLKPLARKLRRESTMAEIMLWNELKGKKMRRYDFHRQRPIDEFIVDFFCSELSLAIEIDGVSHDGAREHDALRQQRLERLGVHVLRFSDADVRQHLEGVTLAIEEWIDGHDKGASGYTPPAPYGEGR